MTSCLNTFSIVARCNETGELGAAVATAVPAVGAICLYLAPQTGAISTQSWVNPYLAIDILERLEAGVAADVALARVLDEDPSAALRQVGVIGLTGQPAAWSGSDCTSWFGHRVGDDYTVQGNMLTGPEVIEAMEEAFRRSADEPLEERLLRALEGAQSVGGDKRGRQSAAVKVMGREIYARVDLRVDEHPDPIGELRRVAEVARLQLAPFIAGMPKRDAEATAAPDTVVDMLSKSPPRRPGGGGSETP